MITQNPIIGKSRKRLGNVYARTLYGKNVLQTCPPPRKGKETESMKKAMNIFALVSQMSNEVSASFLNQIYYQPPVGRNRRQQFHKDLAKGQVKRDEQWSFDTSLIERIGNNPVVTTVEKTLTLVSNQLILPMNELSYTSLAITEESPCIMVICPEKKYCNEILNGVSINNDNLTIERFPDILLQKEITLFTLWKTNIGTEANPIITYGGFRKYN